MGMDRCGVYGFVQVGGFPSCHVVGCSYSGVDTEGVEVKIPFDKRPKTRVKVLWIYALCGVGFLPSSGSVRPGWGVRGVRCWVSSVLCFARRGLPITELGLGHVLLVLGLWVTGW